MAGLSQIGTSLALGISAYLFPSQLMRVRSLVIFILGQIIYCFAKSSRKPEVLGQGRLRQVLEECSNVFNSVYYPTPWCVGPHFHTILRVFLQHIPPVRMEREYINTVDGGQFALDWVITTGPDDLDKPIVVVVPGITGGSHNNYVRHLALNGLNNRCRVLVFNNRGCGHSTLLTPRTYSGSNTEDISLAMLTLAERYPNAPVIIVAVSLGGMITTHYMASQDCSTSNLKAACIISSPWNSFSTSESVNEPINHILYERYLLGKLKNMLDKHQHLYTNQRLPINFRHVMKSQTLREFDDRFTAKMFGYKDWKEYYNHGHSYNKLPHVDIPTLIITAEDDPLSDCNYLPFQEVEQNPNLAMVITKTGGHIGFLEGWLPTGATWLNRAVNEFIQIMTYTNFLQNNEFKDIDDYY